jgi:hypothetical protein
MVLIQPLCHAALLADDAADAQQLSVSPLLLRHQLVERLCHGTGSAAAAWQTHLEVAGAHLAKCVGKAVQERVRRGWSGHMVLPIRLADNSSLR